MTSGGPGLGLSHPVSPRSAWCWLEDALSLTSWGRLGPYSQSICHGVESGLATADDAARVVA